MLSLFGLHIAGFSSNLVVVIYDITVTITFYLAVFIYRNKLLPGKLVVSCYLPYASNVAFHAIHAFTDNGLTVGLIMLAVFIVSLLYMFIIYYESRS